MGRESRRTRYAYLFLLLVVAAEVVSVESTIAMRKGNHPAAIARRRATEEEDDRKEKEAAKEKKSKPSDPDDEKGSFIADQIRKVDCDVKRVFEILREARKQKIRISPKELQEQFKTCSKEKVLKKAKDLGSKEDKEQNKEDNENEEEEKKNKIHTIFEDNFQNGWQRRKWIEPEGRYARMFNTGRGNKGIIVDGNKAGKSLNNNGTRTLTTDKIDGTNGGVLSFDLKIGDADGEGNCQREYKKLVKAEEDEKRRIEQEEKYKAEQAAKKKAEQDAKKKAEEAKKAKKRAEEALKNRRKQDEMNAQKKCLNSPPCHGRGKGVYSSKCDKKTWVCTQRQCKCNCNPGFLGSRCERRFSTGSCQSVGDPHPRTADGMRFNVYDAGEFLYFKHPKVESEVHLLTRMAHPRIAATAGVAVKYKGATMALEHPNCQNGNTPRIHYQENGKCKKLNWGSSWTAPNGMRLSGRHIYTPDGIDIYTGGWFNYRWFKGPCNRASWLNVYVRFRAPRDGQSTGLCGSFGRGRSYDYNRIVRGHGTRHRNQISRETRDREIIQAKDSFFKCGEWNPQFRYSPYFKSLKAGQNLRSMTQAAAMVDAEAKLAREFARNRILNEKTLGDEPGKEPMSREKAMIECKKKEDITTEEALSNCVNDLSMTADPQVEKVAAEESEEENEEAAEGIKEDEKEEELEVAAEAKMKVAGDMDVVVQWCTDDCKKEKSWKQLKAYPEKVYGDFLKDSYRRMTAKLPPKAQKKTLQLRWYQKEHECFCCNPFMIDNVKVVSGGLPIAIVADKKFELYADGKSIGEGEWWEPAKDTYRFRAPTDTKVFAVKVDGGHEARMGLIAKLGPSLVTSSSWKCTMNKENRWNEANFNDKHWPAAVEEGRNGILPWGERPGIAKKAFWIFTHDNYRMKGQTAYCRVNVAEAEMSHSKENKDASRWTCKASGNRQAPSSLQLNADMMTAVEVRNGEEKDEHFSPGVSMTTKVIGKDESRILLKIKASSFMDKSVEGGMLKRAVLRLFVLDETPNSIYMCKVIRKWSAAEVTWSTQPAYDGPKENCVSGKATQKKQWAEFDISDWMRDWVSDSKTNFGIVVLPSGSDAASFVNFMDPDAEQRPRLSMSCHGDRADATAVFKEKKVNFKRTKQ